MLAAPSSVSSFTSPIRTSSLGLHHSIMLSVCACLFTPCVPQDATDETRQRARGAGEREWTRKPQNV